MSKAVTLTSSYLSADISDVLNSGTYYRMCPHSADSFHVLLNWKEDSIKLCQFIFMGKQMQLIPSPFAFKGSGFGDHCSKTALCRLA